MSLLVVYNPACGDATAERFFDAHVIPRLHTANRIPTEIIRTRGPGDAGIETLGFFRRHEGDITVVLGSGDGTLHEIVNHLAVASTPEDQASRAVYFVLVPCGTANALYASLFRPSPAQDTITYKLRSLEAFLGASTSRSLNMSLTSLLSPVGQNSSRPVASIVVTSTALHAAILRDSERLRKEMPGIERFKVAAQENMTNWYASRVKLFPTPSSGVVYVYDPETGDFIPFRDYNKSSPALDVHGPFAYFLSTVNVDRLEPEFRINPMTLNSPPRDASVDVIIVRPKRDPTFTQDTPRAREKFAEKTVAVLTAAYRNGIHIDLRYSQDGDIVESGNGNTVAECFRCGGWEWIPDETDENAHLVCADGTIFEIEKGGRAVCNAASQTDKTLKGFYVHV